MNRPRARGMRKMVVELFRLQKISFEKARKSLEKLGKIGRYSPEIIAEALVSLMEEKNGKARVIAVFAKRARGLMTDFILRNRLQRVEDIKDFSVAGYRYAPTLSDDKQWTFARPQP